MRLNAIKKVVGWGKELKIYRNGNSAKVFLFADNGQDFEELFTPIWNGVAVSVWYVSSTQVVRQDGLKITQINKIRIEKTPFPKKNIDIILTVRMLKSVSYILKRINKKYICIYKLPRSKTPKTQQIERRQT